MIAKKYISEHYKMSKYFQMSKKNLYEYFYNFHTIINIVIELEQIKNTNEWGRNDGIYQTTK